jgi:hypothetical protein
MRVGTHHAEHVFLHPVVYAGHVVHSDAFGALNVNALFLCSGGTGIDSTKRAQDTLGRTCVFCIIRDL